MNQAMSHPGGMRPVSRAVWVLVAALVVAVLGWILASRPERREIVLSDGSILIVEGFTFGPDHVMALEPPLWTAVKQALPSGWHQFTGPPVMPRTVRGEDRALMWLTHLDSTRTRHLAASDVRIQSLTADGETFDMVGMMGWGPGQPMSAALQLGVVDWRRDPLRFRIKQGRVAQDITLRNPKRGERFPVWKPGPLPSTNVHEGFEFVLTGIARHGLPASPFSIPQVEITREGRPMNHCFSSQWSFRDPTGNRGWIGLPQSEPVWQLVLTATPSGAFPFPEESIVQVGRCVVPGPGRFQVIPTREGWSEKGLRAVVVTGPGGFVFRNGTNTLAGKRGEVAPGDSFELSPGPNGAGLGWSFSSDSGQTMIRVILSGPELQEGKAPDARLMPGHEGRSASALVLRARRRDGTFVNPDGSWESSSSDGRNRLIMTGFPLDPVDAGQELDLELVRVPRWTIEWKVACPQGR